MYKAQNFRDLFLSDSAVASSARRALDKSVEKQLADHLYDDGEIEAALSGRQSSLQAVISDFLTELYRASVDLDGQTGEDLQETLMDMQKSMSPTDPRDAQTRLAEKLMRMTHREFAAYSDTDGWLSI